MNLSDYKVCESYKRLFYTNDCESIYTCDGYQMFKFIGTDILSLTSISITQGLTADSIYTNNYSTVSPSDSDNYSNSAILFIHEIPTTLSYTNIFNSFIAQHHYNTQTDINTNNFLWTICDYIRSDNFHDSFVAPFWASDINCSFLRARDTTSDDSRVYSQHNSILIDTDSTCNWSTNSFNSEQSCNSTYSYKSTNSTFSQYGNNSYGSVYTSVGPNSFYSRSSSSMSQFLYADEWTGTNTYTRSAYSVGGNINNFHHSGRYSCYNTSSFIKADYAQHNNLSYSPGGFTYMDTAFLADGAVAGNNKYMQTTMSKIYASLNYASINKYELYPDAPLSAYNLYNWNTNGCNNINTANLNYVGNNSSCNNTNVYFIPHCINNIQANNTNAVITNAVNNANNVVDLGYCNTAFNNACNAVRINTDLPYSLSGAFYSQCITIHDIPTDPTGLECGHVWYCTTDCTLRIVTS